MSLVKFREYLVVSFNPPLLDLITAHPLLAASRLDLPKGSSHLYGITAILISFNLSKINLFGLNVKILSLL